MSDTHFKSYQNQFLHLDTEKILSAPLYILLGLKQTYSRFHKKLIQGSIVEGGRFCSYFWDKQLPNLHVPV